MTNYVWAVGFDWNETRKAPSDPARRLATMCMSLGSTVVPPTAGGAYEIDRRVTENLDFRLFDRTVWNGNPPLASAFDIADFLVRFDRAKGASATQPQSPINSITFVSHISQDPAPAETTPCFANEVSGHAWDAGLSTILYNGKYELTISFDVTYDGTTRRFQKDPEMEVSGVSG